MSSPESFFSFFGRGKKDKDKTGEPVSVRPTPDALATEEYTEKITRGTILNTALARSEQLIADAEKYRETKKGLNMLAKISALLDVIEKAKDGDTASMAELREGYLRAKAGPDTITATTPEGKEVSVDIKAIFSDSLLFYNEHDLKEFSEPLETIEPSLSVEAQATIKEMVEKHGFDQFIILPSEHVQHGEAIIQKLKTNLADKKLPGLSETDQYTTSFISDDCKNPAFPDSDYGREAAEKRSGAYLLGYSSSPVPRASKNLTYSQAEEYLKNKNLNGLTLPEYYILQRRETEANTSHSFDAYSGEAKKSNWTWLVDSRAPGGCVSAIWDPGGRQVDVSWDSAGLQRSLLGARPAIVVPLL